MGVVEENDHSLPVKGVEDSHKLIGDFWNMVNNRQKVSVNILTYNMVYEQEVEGKQMLSSVGQIRCHLPTPAICVQG